MDVKNLCNAAVRCKYADGDSGGSITTNKTKNPLANFRVQIHLTVVFTGVPFGRAAMDVSASLSTAIKLIKSFNPAVSTVDTHVADTLGVFEDVSASAKPLPRPRG